MYGYVRSRDVGERGGTAIDVIENFRESGGTKQLVSNDVSFLLGNNVFKLFT